MMVKRNSGPNLIEALAPVVFLILLLAVNVYVFRDTSQEGPNQIALIFAAAMAALIGAKLGKTWQDLLDGILKNIHAAMGAMLILLLIGALAGTWMLSGVVPAMIYYGLQMLSPVIFLFAACVVCAIVSLASGSSWSTIATIGIALLGIGQALGIHQGIVAGAIISGAYFGDKVSPLSDTTNLAPAMAGTDLFTHIRYLLLTTVPSIIITLIIFLIMGFNFESRQEGPGVEQVLRAIDAVFEINLWLFLVPVAVIGLIIKKTPAIPALLVGVISGGLFAVVFQPQIIVQVSGITENYPLSAYVAVLQSMFARVNIITDNEVVNELLSTGGMSGMLNTVWLIICAMVFGGVMEAAGLLQKITSSIIQFAHSTGSLIASTAASCIFLNVTASDQYLAIVVPGRMFALEYEKRGLKPENLSRTLEDSGTVTSVLVPWNTCGATQASVLGVATIVYFPYCFFNIISPVMTVLFGYLNIKLARQKLPKND
jgi:Na+:H+ antiporter, NhaC family